MTFNEVRGSSDEAYWKVCCIDERQITDFWGWQRSMAFGARNCRDTVGLCCEQAFICVALTGIMYVADVQGGSGKGWMSRSDYNDSGPGGIGEFILS